MLIHILISCVLANQIDIFLVVEETVKLSDVRVVHKGVDFNFTKYILLHFQHPHLLFVQNFQRTYETSRFLNRSKNLTVSALSNF